MKAPLLELRQVVKRFGNHTVLDGVNLQLGCGEALAAIGPSGTGKSTILRIISGLLPPDAGEVAFDPAGPIRVGMVFQNAALFDSLTVAENVGFALFEHSRLHRREILRLVREKLAMVGLPDIGDRYPAELSGGMRKRVSLARAILEDPTQAQTGRRILLYDEPTAGLDPVASTVIEDLIRSLKDRGHACDSYIIVTHQESTIRRTADRVVMLYAGQVQWDGPITEVDRTDNPYIRQFFSGSLDGPIHVPTGA